MIRDPSSHALIVTDKAALDKYRREKRRIQEFDQLRRDVAGLQEKIDHICMIIDQLMKREQQVDVQNNSTS